MLFWEKQSFASQSRILNLFGLVTISSLFYILHPPKQKLSTKQIRKYIIHFQVEKLSTTDRLLLMLFWIIHHKIDKTEIDLTIIATKNRNWATNKLDTSTPANKICPMCSVIHVRWPICSIKDWFQLWKQLHYTCSFTNGHLHNSQMCPVITCYGTNGFLLKNVKSIGILSERTKKWTVGSTLTLNGND